MKKFLFIIVMAIMSLSSYAQPAFGGSMPQAMRPIWTATQPSYFNVNMDRNVNVFISRSFDQNGSIPAETVMFDIAGTGEFADAGRQTIIFFDIPKLLGALDVCYETLSEVSTLSRRARNALVEGMDTIFPRAAVMWNNNDTLIASYNNVIRPDIKIESGQAKLIITGKAVCRVKFDETMSDPTFAGDENITTEYSLVFSSAAEVAELESIIQNSVSEKNRRPVWMRPQNAFPRVFDRDLKQNDFNGFMHRFNPTWDPTVRPFAIQRRFRMIGSQGHQSE